MKINNLIFILLLFALVTAGCSDDRDFNGGDNYITSFRLEKDGISFNGSISTINNEIVVTVPENILLNNATVNITISENATISPDPSSIKDWTAEQTFVVKGYNGTERSYKYKLERGVVSRNGDIKLLTQEDVNAFADMGLTEINGNITIGAASGSDSIHTLAPFSKLTSIKFGLTINPTYAGKNLDDLKNLKKLGSLKVVELNNTLEEINLPQLEYIVTGINIDLPKRLQKILLPELKHVDRGIYISKAEVLKMLDLGKLETVIEDFTLDGGWGTNVLDEFKIGSLKSVGGSFKVSNWQELKSLSMPNLDNIYKLELSSLKKVEKIDLSYLKTIKSDFQISNNDLLTNLNVSSLTTIGGDFNLNYLPSIPSFDGFKSLSSVDGKFTLSNLDKLKDTKGFKSLKSVGKQFDISYMAAVEDNLDGFSSLSSVGVGGVSINDVSFKTFSGFNLKNVERIGIYAQNITSIREIDLTRLNIEKSIILNNIMSEYTLKGANVFDGELSFEGCAPKVVEGYSELGTLKFSLSSNKYPNYSFPTTKVKKDLSISMYNFEGFKMPNLIEAGGIVTIFIMSETLALELPKIKSMGSLEIGSPVMRKLSLPALETINGDCRIITANYMGEFEEFNIPKLKTINGTLDFSGEYYTNNKLTNLDFFATLNSLKAVTIKYNKVLVDFSGLKNALSSISEKGWIVTDNAYNPTYTDAKAGKLIKP